MSSNQTNLPKRTNAITPEEAEALRQYCNSTTNQQQPQKQESATQIVILTVPGERRYISSGNTAWFSYYAPK